MPADFGCFKQCRPCWPDRFQISLYSYEARSRTWISALISAATRKYWRLSPDFYRFSNSWSRTQLKPLTTAYKANWDLVSQTVLISLNVDQTHDLLLTARKLVEIQGIELLRSPCKRDRLPLHQPGIKWTCSQDSNLNCCS